MIYSFLFPCCMIMNLVAKPCYHPNKLWVVVTGIERFICFFPKKKKKKKKKMLILNSSVCMALKSSSPKKHFCYYKMYMEAKLPFT